MADSPAAACPALEDAVDLFRAAGARYEAARAELELASALTALGREVLALLAAGRSNDEIAAALVLSVRTVESHVAHIYQKVGLRGRTARAAATAYALANGLA